MAGSRTGAAVAPQPRLHFRVQAGLELTGSAVVDVVHLPRVLVHVEELVEEDLLEVHVAHAVVGAVGPLELGVQQRPVLAAGHGADADKVVVHLVNEVPRTAVRPRPNTVVLNEDCVTPRGSNLRSTGHARQCSGGNAASGRDGVAVQQQREEALSVHPAGHAHTGHLQECRRQIHVCCGILKVAAGLDPGTPYNHVDLRVKLIDVALVLWKVEFAHLEPMIAGIQKIRLVCDPQLVGQRKHVGNQVVHTHQSAPSVLERAVDAVCGAVVQHRLTGHVGVVVGACRHRNVPRRRARCRRWPPRRPVVLVPQSGFKRIVRRLWRDVREKGDVRVGPDFADPVQRAIADDRCGVCGLAAVPCARTRCTATCRNSSCACACNRHVHPPHYC
eukprot:m.577371 g.577371  ORF g.577371 m.577371 type:complete len:388 (-) comp22294_c0_seq9:728-1891(-)